MKIDGSWSAWVADGPDIGDVIQQSHPEALPDRIEANGAARSRSQYADLFWRWGTLYGAGDGSTTFGTLDLRGDYVRGWDHGRGVDAGRTFGSWQNGSHIPHDIDAFQLHTLSDVNAARTAGWEPAEIATQVYNSIANRDSVGQATPPYYSAARVRNVAQFFAVKF